MRHVFAFALLASAALVAGCTNEVGVTCPPGQTLCGSVCTFATNDPANCGSCGNVCQGQLLCVNGQCGCGAGLTACGNQCVDTKSSVENCGACGNSCPAPQVCSMSSCADNCATGLINCNRNCVNPQTDSLNCGGCGVVCGQGEKCMAGVCKPECPVGQTVCNGKCSSLINDGNNCGACGNVCPSDFFCVFGTCILGCPQPMTRCQPDGGNSDGGTQCVDTRWDPNNCGGCGGADVSPQPSASPFVPHVCTVPDSHHTDPVCDNGRCGATCENGFNDCTTFGGPGGGGPKRSGPAPQGRNGPPVPAELACFDFTSDNCNCGGCFNSADGWVAEFDATTGASTLCVVSSGFTCGPFGCFSFEQAPQQVCCDSQLTNVDQFFSCGSNCSDAVECDEATATDCCEKPDHSGYACTDTNTDPHNCGGCNLGGDTPFPSNDCEIRFASVPPSSSPFPACCTGEGTSCADLNNDFFNCGACGNECDVVPSSSPQPSNPACCRNVVDRGPTMPTAACVDRFNDVNNCGSCGNKCASGNSCCQNNCTDTTTDVTNCGSCGHNCNSECICGVNGCNPDGSCDCSSCGS